VLAWFKIAFIGAGSVEFTRKYVTGLCSFGELHGDLDLSLALTPFRGHLVGEDVHHGMHTSGVHS
jgi:hypothetical protein